MLIYKKARQQKTFLENKNPIRQKNINKKQQYTRLYKSHHNSHYKHNYKCIDKRQYNVIVTCKDCGIV